MTEHGVYGNLRDVYANIFLLQTMKPRPREDKWLRNKYLSYGTVRPENSLLRVLL